MRIGWLLWVAALAPQQNIVLEKIGPKAPDVEFWLPRAYKKGDPALGWVRKPTPENGDTVLLHFVVLTERAPMTPAPPTQEAIERAETEFKQVKLKEATLQSWKGRLVPAARYEAALPNNAQIVGRMIWLPLQPGTLIVNVLSEPISERSMNDDFEKITASVSGPTIEFTLHERAPGRWLASVLLAVLGALVGFVGHIMVVAEINRELGGGMGSLSFFVPPVSLGYGLIHFYSCRTGILLFGAGVVLYLIAIVITI